MQLQPVQLSAAEPVQRPLQLPDSPALPGDGLRGGALLGKQPVHPGPGGSPAERLDAGEEGQAGLRSRLPLRRTLSALPVRGVLLRGGGVRDRGRLRGGKLAGGEHVIGPGDQIVQKILQLPAVPPGMAVAGVGRQAAARPLRLCPGSQVPHNILPAGGEVLGQTGRPLLRRGVVPKAVLQTVGDRLKLIRQTALVAQDVAPHGVIADVGQQNGAVQPSGQDAGHAGIQNAPPPPDKHPLPPLRPLHLGHLQPGHVQLTHVDHAGLQPLQLRLDMLAPLVRTDQHI